MNYVRFITSSAMVGKVGSGIFHWLWVVISKAEAPDAE
jgi:hypothetical protein